MKLSLSAAAKATGRSKSTIGRAIKSGKLSAYRDEAGGYCIDASELARAFDWDPQAKDLWSVTEPMGPPAGPEAAPSAELLVLRTRLELLEQALEREREALAHERETTEDLRQRLDRSDERVRALLFQQPTSAPTRGLLARLLGR